MTLVPLPSEHVAHEIETGGRWFFRQAQRLLRLAAEQQTHAGLIKTQAAEITSQRERIDSLEQAMNRLQAREGELLARVEAEAAKSAAAATNDLARRIGFIEGRASRD